MLIMLVANEDTLDTIFKELQWTDWKSFPIRLGREYQSGRARRQTNDYRTAYSS